MVISQLIRSHSIWSGPLIAMLLCLGCGQTRTGHEDLDATLWIQTSAEYQAICRQAYATARTQLAKALDDPYWSADPIQQQRLSRLQPSVEPLRPAVILDIDETVLDNSPYQARLVDRNTSFDLESWHEWVLESHAERVPGAGKFIQTAEEAGVTVFFVTNREVSVEHATRENLVTRGLVQADEVDRILSKHERSSWTSDKESRRRHIARRYRILLMIGDDLNDFVSTGNQPTPQTRCELQELHADKWGDRWIMLPNPNYGGWERSVYHWNDSAPDPTKLKHKLQQLDSAIPGTTAATP